MWPTVFLNRPEAVYDIMSYHASAGRAQIHRASIAVEELHLLDVKPRLAADVASNDHILAVAPLSVFEKAHRMTIHAAHKWFVPLQCSVTHRGEL